MKRILNLFATLIVVTFSTVSISTAQSSGPLDGQVFGSGDKVLVVVLHGDISKGGSANYHYSIAKKIASQNKSATVMAMLRPGYSDGKGRKSKGSNNNRRDHYTKKNNDLVAQTIKAMQKQTGAAHVVAIGHSGGAAQIGTIIGRYAGLIDSAILVSCPCNISKWRTMRGRSAWTASQSPSKYVSKIGSKTRVIAITGSNDSNTSLSLAKEFVDAAKKSGTNAKLIPVSGASHGFNRLESAALSATKKEIKRY